MCQGRKRGFLFDTAYVYDAHHYLVLSVPLPFEEGFQAVDCVIDELPLAAGQYVVAASLAVPNMDWLWFRPEVGILSVEARDVYNSGFAPDVKRAAIALHHHWEPVPDYDPASRT